MFRSHFKRAINPVSRVLAGVALLSVSLAVSADYALNLQQPASSIAREIFDLHNLVTILVVGVLLLVSAVMLWSILFHRKGRGRKPATFRDNTRLEMLWVVLPVIVIVVLAVPSTRALLHMEDTSNIDMTLKITGHQWKWEYEYLDEGIKFTSSLATPREQISNQALKGENYLLEVDNPVVLPVGKKIRLLVTSNKVIQSWWVPALGTRKDAIPGFINELWVTIDKPGIYRGQCAELCGQDYGFMPIVIEAVSDSDFKKWANRQKGAMVAAAADLVRTWSLAELIEHGETVYRQNCAACHGVTGVGVPSVFPALAGSKITTGPVKDHVNLVLKGRQGTAMTAFGRQLGDVDIAAVVTYERNAFGNKTGDMVQPSQIKAMRK